MLTSDRLSGIFPAVPTPVRADDSVDAGAVDALFAWLRFAAEERHNWPAKAA